jgi:serine/threonine protein kinase/tetratricopeptide (TPR) repeat protein
MTSDEARRIFNLAVSAPTERRAEILDRECGADSSLRDAVDGLLRASESAEDESEAPTMAVPVAALSAAEGSEQGTAIGQYTVLQLLGEGGFGSVYMAEQVEPVRRKVALKIIKLGMDTREVIARFDAERQALAMMDHPNIARVIDAGATETGRPYFVMDLVKGDPITVYCDKHNLSIRDRLELFAQVCAAVQHAHTKGIIHRDIKPSNVLVSTVDGRPTARVIDFGIAKATNARLTEKTFFTQDRQLIGTLEYMSPEQAEGSLDIDTRTDVYSLGVLLYELLTGSTPIESRELRSAGFAEMQRIIREVDPPNPSARLSQNTDSIEAVAARRRVEPARLGSTIRGDLDWIVMKAIEKDRSRRYETADGLAMDIGRHLEGEAVVAAPPSAAYRAGKFIRRHKGVVFSASAVAVALLIGAVAFAWQARAARAQRDRAVAAEAEATARADELKTVVDFQAEMLAQVNPTKAGAELTENVTSKYEAALVKANPTLSEAQRSRLVKDFAEQWRLVNATDVARDVIDRTILTPAVETIETQFKDQPVVDAQLRQALAVQYSTLALYDKAVPLQERALAERRRVLGQEHPDTLDSISQMGLLLQGLGKVDEAEPYYREALEKRRRVLGGEHPDTLKSISTMDFLFQAQGKLAEAEPYAREALEIRRRVLGDQDPNTLVSISNMCTVLMFQGRLDEAEPYCREALEKRRRFLGEDSGDTVVSINILAYLLEEQGKLDEATPLRSEAVEKSRRVLGEEHPDTQVAVSNMGYLLKKLGRLNEAEPYYREAFETFTRVLGEEHPYSLSSASNLGAVFVAQGRDAEAIDLLAPVEPAMRATFTGDNARVLARFLLSLGSARAGLGFDPDRFAAAEANLLEARELFVATRGEEHEDTRDSVQALADFYDAWAHAAPGEGHEAQAAKWRTAK